MKRHTILLLLFSAVSAAAVFAPLQTRLCVIGYKDKNLIAVLDDNFEISYTHSVNRGRVHDFYTVTSDGSLCLTHTAFVSYGAGMPEPYGDQVFTVTGDTIEISNINREMEELILQTGVIADHVIETGGKSIVMNENIPAQTRIVIGMRSVSRFDLWRMIYGSQQRKNERDGA